jgi:hypothetical protein
MSRSDFLDFLNSYSIMSIDTDSGGTIRKYRQEYDPTATHMVGVIYVDRQAGMSMNIETFCTLMPDGSLRDSGGPPSQKKRVILRYSVFKSISVSALSPEQISALYLPSEIEWLSIYREGMAQVEATRNLSHLDPLRAPGTPDDIKFLLVPDEKNAMQEEIWGRLVKQIDATLFECVLLNQPHQRIGINRTDHVLVHIRNESTSLVSVCIGPSAQFNLSVDMLDRVSVYIKRAKARQHFGDLAGAVADYTNALKIRPSEINLYVLRASCYAYLHNFAAALQDVNRPIELSPDDGVHYMNRATLRALMTDYAGAVEDGKIACKLTPKSAKEFQEVMKPWQSKLN